VVEEFLAFARPGTRRLERCDLAALLTRARPGAALRAARARLAPAAREASFAGDEQLLARALRNLLANAVAAQRDAARARPGGIALDAAGRAGGSRSPTGAGDSAELHERLFEPFASGRPGGVGLGLALARRIVLLHGGTITLQPREGGGTRVEVLLPQAGGGVEENTPSRRPAE
jgi:signal transduction histidine kinase